MGLFDAFLRAVDADYAASRRYNDAVSGTNWLGHAKPNTGSRRERQGYTDARELGHRAAQMARNEESASLFYRHGFEAPRYPYDAPDLPWFGSNDRQHQINDTFRDRQGGWNS